MPGDWRGAEICDQCYWPMTRVETMFEPVWRCVRCGAQRYVVEDDDDWPASEFEVEDAPKPPRPS